MKRLIYLILGLVGLGLGALGAALPLLPAFPFLLLAAICFGKSSERLNRWFLGTKLYKNNLESFHKGKGMTKAAKRRIMLFVTLTMGFGFLMMRRLFWGRVILAVVWVAHLMYFRYGIETIPDAVPDGKPVAKPLKKINLETAD
ncbi:hypothetical protein ABB02_00747 [Clostridiaceae bacterium JG1575]|nr:hypothetical protein ABB02_00747 [Clostridiaceae bacterium JG1575]